MILIWVAIVLICIFLSSFLKVVIGGFERFYFHALESVAFLKIADKGTAWICKKIDRKRGINP